MSWVALLLNKSLFACLSSVFSSSHKEIAALDKYWVECPVIFPNKSQYSNHFLVKTERMEERTKPRCGHSKAYGGRKQILRHETMLSSSV
jgi:hypothetical protein